MHRSWVPILLLAWGGLALADVAEQLGSGAARQPKAAASDSSSPEPMGRGRLALPEEVSLPGFEPEELDRMRAEHGPSWLGPTRAVAEIEGAWAWTQAGERVWRAALRSPGASALRVRFEDFHAEGPVWLYGDEWSGAAIGPYDGSGPHGSGRFWSAFVGSEAVIIEYAPRAAAGGSRQVPFRIAALAHIAAEFPGSSPSVKAGGMEPKALAGCHLDVSCYPDLETRDRSAVAKLYITEPDRTSACTGSLLNAKWDYRDTGRPLLLTAGHCVESEEEAEDISFLWNYQTEECYGNPNWMEWEEPLAYS